MIYLLRASHANQFELQNYASIAKKLDIHVVSSHHPLTPISLPHAELWSPTDLPNFPFRKQILNRLIGGEQWLVGLEKLITPTIVHTAETYTPYTHQAVQLRKRGVIDKLICTCWETIPHNNEKFTRLREWKKEAYKYVDIFHTPTARAKQSLITEGVDPSKIVVIPYGIDLTRFRPRPHPPHTRPLVLTVARLEREKGMQDLEVVAANLLGEYDFLVVGQGSYIPRGKNIKIRIVPYQEIHKIYRSADLFFLPSRTTPTWEEQYGMALIEAMACGLPIITTRSGAIEEVVGHVAIVVKEGDTQAMTQSIRDLYGENSRHMAMSQAGYDRAVSHFDSQKVAQKLAQLYR